MDKSAVQKILLDANEAVEASGVDAHLRPIAFEKAVDLLAGAQRFSTRASNGGDGGGDGSADGGGGGAPAGDKAEAIAKKMHIDIGKIEKVYDLDDDLSITLQRSRLPKDRSNATAEVALLFAAARQAAYGDTVTDIADLRSIADDFGVLDSGNFSTALTKRKNWFTIKGTGKARTLKVTKPGFEDAGKLIEEFTKPGGGS